MTVDAAKVTDAMSSEAGFLRAHVERAGWVGYGKAELFDGDGQLKQLVPFRNLITNWGDQYLATRAYPIMTTLTVTVTGVTNAASAVVTTSGAHGLGVGDKVTIASVVGATGVNGTWVISAVGSTTTFTVPVGAAPGVYSSGGTVTAIASAAAQTYPVASGMKLGTGTTAPNKATPAGMDLGTYTTASQLGFDATYPQFANLGNNLGATCTFKTTWGAGVATASGLAEVVIVAEWPLANATTTSGATSGTVSRALLSPTVNKGASDTLAITWVIKNLGS